MNCDCIKELNEGLIYLDMELVDNKLVLGADPCACGIFEESIEIKYCPICGKKIQSLKEYVEAIMEYCNVNKANDARLIFDSIKHLAHKDDLMGFIEDDLRVFNNINDAYFWFFNDSIDILDDIIITNEMVGKSVKEIALESQENYIKIQNNIHLAWWN